MTDLKTPRRRWHRRALPAASAFLAAVTGVSASAQNVDATKAPPAWIAFAQVVSTTVQARIAGDDQQAVRLRAYLNQLPGAGTPDGTKLDISFWIDSKGKITRIEHAPFAHPEPNDDLQELLVGTVLPGSPPKGMLLPLRLAMHIKPAPEAAQPKATAFTISHRYRIAPKPPGRS